MDGWIPVRALMRRPSSIAPAASDPVGVGVSIKVFRKSICSCFISLSFHLPISPTVDAMVPIASTFLRYASIASFSLATHASRRAFVSASTRSRRYGSVFDLRTLIHPSSYSRR